MNNIYNHTMNDRFRANSTDEQYVQYLCRKLKEPMELILTAIQEVGYDLEEIKEYIRDRSDRELNWSY